MLIVASGKIVPMPELQPEAITAICDTREQLPYNLSPLRMERKTLPTADYSILGLETECALERKSINDLTGCMTSGRERFTAELQRLRGYHHRCIVVECAWSDILEGRYRSKLNPKSAAHTIASWTSNYAVPFAFVGDRQAGEKFTRAFLFLTAKANWQKMQAFAGEVQR